MKLKFFYGTTSWWGLSIDFEPAERSLTVSFIHWFIAFEIWNTK